MAEITEGWACVGLSCYENTEGDTIQREEGLTPSNNQIGGKWVYRKQGKWVDYDQYLVDLCARYKLRLESWM